MAKNLALGPILAPLAQIWAPKIFFHGFYLYCMLDIVASYRCMQFQGKLMIQTWENSKKPSFRPFFFSSKIWLRQSLDIMVSYHHVQYQKKTNDPALRKLRDRRTDGQTDESGFIGRCQSNVER